MNWRLLLWGAACSSAVSAAELTVHVRTPAGMPVREAVVMLHPSSGAARLPARFDSPLVVRQQDIQFHPFVLLVPVGAEVEFPNLDKVRHHVYSFSKAKRFELKLYGHEESRTVVFDKPGPVALGCNIHDAMTAFVRVLDTPYAVKTDADGVAHLPNVPAGAAKLRVWHPWLRAPGNEVMRPVTVGGVPMVQDVAVEIRQPGTAP
jgi:plastocyanin